MAKYVETNREKISAIKKKYYPKSYKMTKERRKKDIYFKLTGLFRSRINNVLKRKGNYRVNKKLKYLGCTSIELINHLESMFLEGMTWENHGINGWHIDHIYPLSKVDFSNEEHLQKYLHYTNLQPLWAKENILKRNKI